MSDKNLKTAVCLWALCSCVVGANSWARELPASEFRGTMITMTRGTVVAVDKAARKISISHQGNWDIEIPATTTAFSVASADMADGLAPGSAIFFIAGGDAKKPELVRLTPRRANGFAY
ncbi:MAG: copper-binding protein [Rhodocyclaceae bacterium]|nr:copper-binding protein [Rhodocyclaceae bacterium]